MTAVPSPVFSAREWACTIGSLSTYTTRASGAIAWATWCTLPLVGSPVPRSRNWRIPHSPARNRTARPRNLRFSRARNGTSGACSVSFRAAIRSAAKLSYIRAAVATLASIPGGAWPPSVTCDLPSLKLLRLLQVVRAALDVSEECLPGLRTEGQVAAVRVLGVAHGRGAAGLCDFDTVIAATAVAGFTPPGGGFWGLGGGHRFSFVNSVIMAVDSAGLSAFCRRWVQARLYRSSSSLDSRYRSPNRPSA